MSRWIIVSNRLPFSFDPETGKYSRSSGGLITAIEGIKNNVERVWCGIAPSGLTPERFRELEHDDTGNGTKSFLPVFVDNSLYDPYYNGFSNSVLWPALHYESQNIQLRKDDWEKYRQVNRLIAEKIAESMQSGDLVWVHDFHLMLVPRYLRELRPEAIIGFFLHVPFPTSEIWRQLPMRDELLHGLLGSDLIGFHDFSYLRHFNSCLEVLEGISSDSYIIRSDRGPILAGVFPVSIDTAAFRDKAASKEVAALTSEFQKGHNHEYTILGIDRLDYAKGIDLKLQAFEEFLESHPEYRDKVRLLQVAVPTREKVEEYKELRNTIEQLVARINGRYGTLNDAPVRYVYSTVSQNELLALYRMADVLLVTSKRDGMNLVCQEYIAAQDEADPGVVILSEFAGAVSNLSQVVSVNPWDTQNVSDAIARCLSMPLDERVRRNGEMLTYLQDYTATAWAEFFIDELTNCIKLRYPASGILEPVSVNSVADSELEATLAKPKLHLFLDWDGTLTALKDKPELVHITREASNLLDELVQLPGVTITIISGRDKHYLETHVPQKDIFLAAEHGAEYFDPEAGSWHSLVRSDISKWYQQAEKLFDLHVKRVPGSFIERKGYGLAWHYRLAPREYSDFQARRLAFDLGQLLKDAPVSVMSGKKVIEVKSFEANKGIFANWYIDTIKYSEERDAIVCMGDDTTDEDMFRVFPKNLSIKVGRSPTDAGYCLHEQSEVLPFLKRLIKLRKVSYPGKK